MTLENLKYNIEHKIKFNDLIILVRGSNDSSKFLCSQYLSAIKDLVGDFDECNNLDDVKNSKSSSLFGESYLICNIESFDCSNNTFKDYTDLIIVCQTITNLENSSYVSNVVLFPELESWHCIDYVMSMCTGLSYDNANTLCKKCYNNIYRIESELEKIKIFNEEYQDTIFQYLVDSDFTSDLNNFDIFNLVNSILNRKFDELSVSWGKAEEFDSDPMLLISVLLSQLKTIIDVFLYPNSTPETCGISQKRFNAIKYYYRNYTKNQLVSMYEFLCDVDAQLKSGELSDINLLDHVIINVIQKGLG